MRITILGTGTSFGVPQIGCTCPVCTSTDPRDVRSRTAAVVESGGRRILIDTPPELRQQLVRAGIATVDAVLYTHDHADHTHGIDDLRGLSGTGRLTLPVYGPADALERMQRKFDYVFDPATIGIPGSSRPSVAVESLVAGRPVTIAGIPVLPLAFEPGPSVVYGYRFGPVAYVTDVKRVPPESVRALAGLEVLVLNALWYREHPTHLSIPEAVAAARAIGARQTWLTHLTHETLHADLERDLPAEIRPAFDGLVVDA